MYQQNHNDVKAVTQVIISELLKNFSNSSDFISSLDIVAELFIQSVLKYNVFKENNYFTREIQIISEDEFFDSILKIKQGDKTGLKCFADYISHNESRKFQFEVPYEYITDYVYFNDVNIEYVVIEERLSSFALCISGKILSLDDSEIKTLEKVFRKFRRHLLLAINQKKYIDDVTSAGAKEAELLADEARVIADNARGIADEAKVIADIAKLVANNAKLAANKAEGITLNVNKAVIDAQEGAQRALNLSSKANVELDKVKKIANKAEETAKQAQNLANEADIQAKSTIANYISILGIFASIIFTLFGGVNLIGSTVKLLEVNSRWPYLTFIIALLMICLLTLLNMMVKWINSMSNLRKVLDNHNEEGRPIVESLWYKPWGWDFYTKAVSFFLLILLISMCGMYNVNKENLFSITTETTTKSVPNVEENTNKPATKLESEDKNKEITVVEKITLSNHPNEKSSDKEE